MHALAVSLVRAVVTSDSSRVWRGQGKKGALYQGRTFWCHWVKPNMLENLKIKKKGVCVCVSGSVEVWITFSHQLSPLQTLTGRAPACHSCSVPGWHTGSLSTVLPFLLEEPALQGRNHVRRAGGKPWPCQRSPGPRAPRGERMCESGCRCEGLGEETWGTKRRRRPVRGTGGQRREEIGEWKELWEQRIKIVGGDLEGQRQQGNVGN